MPTTEQVWEEIEKQMFAVLGYTTPRGEARTVGIVYSTEAHKIYIGSFKEAWKTKHIRANPKVSLTIPSPRRVWYLPWIKIPPATITLSGTARILEVPEVPEQVGKALIESLKEEGMVENSVVLEIRPEGEFLTYGIGVPLKAMLSPSEASGRAPVG